MFRLILILFLISVVCSANASDLKEHTPTYLPLPASIQPVPASIPPTDSAQKSDAARGNSTQVDIEKKVKDLYLGTPVLHFGYGGVGMSLCPNAQGSEARETKIFVYKGSPAERAGIKDGDILKEVDGQPYKGSTVGEKTRAELKGEAFKSSEIERIRGKPGTGVVLTIAREGVAKPMRFHVVREKINYAVQGLKYYRDEFKFLRPLAVHGMPEAQNSLGVLYESGLAVDQDDAAAAMWYRKAADKGNSLAQQNLSKLYYDGRGVEQNYEEAAFWYTIARGTGSDHIQYEDHLTSEQISAVRKRVMAWKPVITKH